MNVRMLEYRKGSNDGYTTKEFKVGMAYAVPAEMSEYLAKAWLSQGIAEVVGNEPKEKKVVKPTETKKKNTRKPRTKKES